MEEVDKGARPIEGVATSIAAFVGFAETGPINQPTFITNWTQFQQTFGGFIPGSYLAPAVMGFFANGGGTCYITRLPTPVAANDGDKAKLDAASATLPTRGKAELSGLEVRALNPGTEGSQLSVQVVDPTPVEGQALPEDVFTLVVKRDGEIVERFENVTLRRGKGAKNLIDTVKAESKLVAVAERDGVAGSPLERTPPIGQTYSLAMPNPAAIVPAKISAANLVGSVPERSGVQGLEVAEDATMLLFPDLMALYQAGAIDMEGVQAVQQAMLDHCQNMRYRVAILDTPPGLSPQQVRDWRMAVNYDSKYGAMYYPWIKVANPLANGKGPASIYVPPSGHIAGIWARSDSQRGVHKAPANEVVAGCIGLETQMTAGEQSVLNPIGVNCIRTFPGRGIRVWGARMLSSDPAWRYLNVRRLFNYVEASIERSTQWTVFEPNDFDLWAAIRRDVGAFLSRVWREGALFGASADQAFYVKCDAELNTPEVRDAGQVIIEIGIAPVKPAEFVIFRVSQFNPSA
jgi:phage tail sheath protein FI